ncbi:Hypothetical protein ETEE_3242 [Edwardsiella anguillarum ET080813]|uniref:Uncharacterized protein n=1 Tax=Edwardsiella anguillarum ET080813 TaxID=667120 RepID=A0A076LSM9_9GAMM|nr:Hypothetical protein ETEE_3242 [Edwardsiella anguillarum ET080813]
MLYANINMKFSWYYSVIMPMLEADYLQELFKTGLSEKYQ